MLTHGVGGTINMISGHIAWFFPSQTWALYLHVATVPGWWMNCIYRCMVMFCKCVPNFVAVMCYTAWHMGTVAMGTFRVDIVYKIGAVFWAWPAITFLLWSEKSDLYACSFSSLLFVIFHRPSSFAAGLTTVSTTHSKCLVTLKHFASCESVKCKSHILKYCKITPCVDWLPSHGCCVTDCISNKFFDSQVDQSGGWNCN